MATALALAFALWRQGFQALFLAVHQAYPVVDWYVIPVGVVIDLAMVFGPRIVAALSAGRDPVFRSYTALIVVGVSGIVAALVLYGGIVVMGATGQIIPAAPPAALPFACLTGAFGAILGHTIATRMLEAVRQARAARKETAAVAAGAKLQGEGALG